MYSSSTTTTASAVRLRRARPDESDDLRELVGAAFAQYRQVLPGALFERYLKDLRSVADDTAFTIVAERDGRIAGSVRFVPPSAPGEPAGIRALSVHPLDRGHRIGERLVQTAERLALNAGATVLRSPHLAGHAKRRDALRAPRLPPCTRARRRPDAALPDLAVPSDLAVIAYQRDLRSTSTTSHTKNNKENQK